MPWRNYSRCWRLYEEAERAASWRSRSRSASSEPRGVASECEQAELRPSAGGAVASLGKKGLIVWRPAGEADAGRQK